MSEPEMKTIENIVKPRAEQIKLFHTLHSSGCMFLSPYGYAHVLPDNHQEHVS